MTATKQVGNSIQSVQKCTRANIVQVELSVEHIANATRMAGISGQALQEIVLPCRSRIDASQLNRRCCRTAILSQ